MELAPDPRDPPGPGRSEPDGAPRRDPPGTPRRDPPGALRRGRPARRGDVLLAGAGYLMLFVLGAAEGIVGCFYYGSGPAPVAAVGFALAILATCLLAAWGMGRPAGALSAAVGWFAPAFLLASATRGGSVVITNTAAGQWFLFGGSACIVAALIAAFVAGSSRGSRRG